jgi:hypothetical protein
VKSLAQLQRDFLAAIYSEDRLDGRAAVYRRNVLGNQHEALAAAYPVVRRLVGDAFFREVADRYARAHPSPSGDLHRHGSALAQFLEGYGPARELPYLPDVARLEWEVAQAFHESDARVFDFRALESVDGDSRASLRLSLQPAARLVESRHPIVAIWEANQEGRDGTPARHEGGDNALVHREGYAVRVVSLTADDHRFLRAVERGATLGDMAADDGLAPVFTEQLVKWTRAGVIDGFSSLPR